MATVAQINAHEKLMSSLATQFEAGLEPVLVQFFDQLSQIENPTRLQVQQLFQPVRQYSQTELQNINAVIQSNVEINQLVLGPTVDSETQAQLAELRTSADSTVNTQLDEEQSLLIDAIMFALITGGLIVAITQLRKTIPSIVKRTRLKFDTAVRSVDGAFTLLRGRKSEVSYRYSGGVIAESRDFCRQLNGRTFTESQIRSIWANQTWGGKRPGDPFVTRGGWNCRHSWIPVKDK